MGRDLGVALDIVERSVVILTAEEHYLLTDRIVGRLGGSARWSRLQHAYDARPRKDKRGFDLVSDALAFGGL